jgi:hypothetical protein
MIQQQQVPNYNNYYSHNPSYQDYFNNPNPVPAYYENEEEQAKEEERKKQKELLKQQQLQEEMVSQMQNKLYIAQDEQKVPQPMPNAPPVSHSSCYDVITVWIWQSDNTPTLMPVTSTTDFIEMDNSVDQIEIYIEDLDSAALYAHSGELEEMADVSADSTYEACQLDLNKSSQMLAMTAGRLVALGHAHVPSAELGTIAKELVTYVS